MNKNLLLAILFISPMFRNQFVNHLLLGLSVFCLFSCGSGTKNEDPTPDNVSSDREIMLQYMADEIIIPSYANFKVKLDDLTTKSDAFTDNPTTATLSDFRASWVEAYKEWQKVELYDFGPASSTALRFYFNIYPASSAQIETNITGTPNLNLPVNYATQGFPALDYLLNGLGTDIETIEKYTTDAAAAKRTAYLKTLISRMNSFYSAVYNNWNTGGYRESFISKTSLDMNSSTSLLVNAYVLNYERYIRSAKIGIPAGIMTAGQTHPDRVEAFYKKDLSLELAKIASQASIDFFNGKSVKTGTNGYSLKTYLNSIGARETVSGDSLSKIINEKFTNVTSTLNLLGSDLSSEVVNNNTKMVDAYNALQTMVRLLKLDMTSAMSITITYTDNDGD